VDDPGDRPDPSPLEVLPGLAEIAQVMTDAVAVTDLHRRVVVWNDAAEQLYGITAADALGAPIDDLFDSVVVGAGTSASGARALALTTGSWRGRVADRPRVGRLVDHERVSEAVLSRIDGPDGSPVGVLSVKRDVTPGVRVERELATVISLAAAGERRSRQATADRALEIVIGTTAASGGAILVPDGDRIGVLATQGSTAGELVEVVSTISWSASAAVRAVAPVGRVVNGPTALLPLAPVVRRALLAADVRSLVLVGLHRDEELAGVLILGWEMEDPVIPSDAVILLVADHLARGLENARLVEEIVRRAESERDLARRLRALDELTRVADHVTTQDELVERSARLINTVLDAVGTAYGLLGPDGESYATTHLAQVRPALATWLRDHRPDERDAFRRWRAGEGPFLEPLEPGRLSSGDLALAREAGVSAYAAIPVRIEDQVVGGISAYFDGPAADLDLDRDALERVASIASIALANVRLRERLAAAEQRYRSLVEASPDAIVVATGDGTIIDANPVAAELFRTDPARLVGRLVTDLSDLDLADVRDRTGDLATGRTSRTRAVIAAEIGPAFPVEVDATVVDVEGEPRLLLRLRDLTEQERLQAELVQAQKMEATGQLVSGVAHELNNPLASILGFSQVIRRDPALPEELRHSADLLVEEATRTRRIVQNLLDFTRQRPPERHPTSIRALVDSVLALQTYSLERGSIAVETDIPDGLPPVELDRGQLQQVLVNLTGNAIYALRNGGGSHLRISAAPEGPPDDPRIRVTVMDDGPGIAPEHVGRLFEAFFTTKPAADGTGLGLSVSYGIVAAHGGELRYGPTAWGRGAAFTFDLPVHASATTPAPAIGGSAPGPASGSSPDPVATAAPTQPGRGRVLVVDDEPSLRVFLGRALRSIGLEAVICAGGREAMALAAGPYAAIVCDHRMPGMSGVQVFEAMATDEPDLARRFVMMSGDTLDPDLAAFLTDHAVSVLAKPFDLDMLERVLDDIVGHPSGILAGDPAATAAARAQPRG
jgi:two-component system NtrC family sensor kinase